MLTLFVAEARRKLDVYPGVEVPSVIGLSDGRHSVPFEAEQLAVLSQWWNPQSC